MRGNAVTGEGHQDGRESIRRQRRRRDRTAQVRHSRHDNSTTARLAGRIRSVLQADQHLRGRHWVSGPRTVGALLRQQQILPALGRRTRFEHDRQTDTIDGAKATDGEENNKRDHGLPE
jgi:hypothetical protein